MLSGFLHLSTFLWQTNLAVNQFDGNFFWPNLFYTGASVPFIYVAWSLGKGTQKEEQANELLKNTA